MLYWVLNACFEIMAMKKGEKCLSGPADEEEENSRFATIEGKKCRQSIV